MPMLDASEIPKATGAAVYTDMKLPDEETVNTLRKKSRCRYGA